MATTIARLRTAARLGVPGVRAGWWALRCVLSARCQLARQGSAPVSLPPVPASAPAGAPLMDAVLRRSGRTCLERALVRQAWLAACGDPRDVVVGVTRPREFSAHAWLDGDAADAGGGSFAELLRLPPGRRSQSR